MRDVNCPICQSLSSDRLIDIPLWTSPGYTIMRTMNYKGHAKRCMIVSTSHNYTVGWNENSAAMILFEFIIENHRDHDWTIMEPTHATIPDHPHLVACTLDHGDDMQQIRDTDRIQIHFKRRGQSIVDGCTI